MRGVTVKWTPGEQDERPPVERCEGQWRLDSYASAQRTHWVLQDVTWETGSLDGPVGPSEDVIM